MLFQSGDTLVYAVAPNRFKVQPDSLFYDVYYWGNTDSASPSSFTASSILATTVHMRVAPSIKLNKTQGAQIQRRLHEKTCSIPANPIIHDLQYAY